MKKFLFLMLTCSLVLSNFSCSSDDEEDSTVIKVPDQKELTQTPYAAANAASVSFNAPQPWTAAISELKEAALPAPAPWLTLDKYEGAAGAVKLNMQLETNYTGASRSAKVTIVSGESSIQVSVTQQAVNADGEKPVDPNPVTSVTLSKDTVTLFVNTKDTLVASVLPQNATIKTLVWSTSDNKVATVSQTGEVVAIAKGEAVITVSSTADAAKTASCVVFVRDERPATGTGEFSYRMDSDTTKVYKLNIISAEKIYTKVENIRIDSANTVTGALYQLNFFEKQQPDINFYLDILHLDANNLAAGTYYLGDYANMTIGKFYAQNGTIGGKSFYVESGAVIVEKKDNAYTITVNIRTTENGKDNPGRIKGSYTGTIPTAETE